MNEEALKLTLSSSPHAHSPNSTRRIMLDVCIALLPALIGAIVFFGARALTLTALSVAGCVFFEWAYRRIMKKDNTTGDLSAVVTGILVAFVCPVTLPFWMYEPRHAVADKSSDLVRCALAKAESAQGVVGAVPQVVERVQQSAVEVKYNIIVFHEYAPRILLFSCIYLLYRRFFLCQCGVHKVFTNKLLTKSARSCIV